MQADAESTTSYPSDTQMAYREKLRQGYMDAMGIQTWYPRYELVNARSSRPFDWIEEDNKTLGIKPTSSVSIPVATLENQNKEPAPGYKPTRAADILGQFMSAAKETVPASEQTKTSINTKPEPVQVTNTAISKFRLIIQPVTDECIVVAEMPHSGLNQFSRFHQRLLDDMLRALKITPEPTITFREFIWPMSENRGLLSRINQDDHSAADAVSAFLRNQYGLSRLKTILLLGQSAARFVLDPEKGFEQLRGIQQGIYPDQHFVVTYGLNELMKQSILKKEAWQDIAPLLSLPNS
ncbi:MAG: hypothetical protein ACPGEF_06820 [Endozoicomonas sp.]